MVYIIYRVVFKLYLLCIFSKRKCYKDASSLFLNIFIETDVSIESCRIDI
jgi:hypothetical protein